ncbi:MAG: Demethylmenaquinone methyltransferase [candidate division WS2 bacterium]|nr:Demethylmenaquinone methyltransferase [Candidatus Lithacetigena glycinireducens]
MEDWPGSYFDEDYLRTLLIKDDPQRNIQQVNFVLTETGVTRDSLILDLGCGYGRHLEVFSQHSYRVVGLDFNRNYLLKAREKSNSKGRNMDLIQGDMRKLPLQDNIFDLVTLFFTSFGYFTEEDDAKTLLEINRVLRNGGYLFLDLENRDHIIRYFKTDEIREYPAFTLLERHRFDIHTGIQHTRRIYFRKEEKKEVKRELRLYSFAEMKRILEETGFLVEKVFGDYNRTALNLESTRMLILAKNVN